MEKINALWFKHLSQKDPEAKQKREDLVLGNNILLDILTEIIEDDVRDLEAQPVSDYDNPNWPYREADRKGQLRALRKVLSLTKRKLHV